MKNFFLHIVLFSLFSLIFYIVILFVWEEYAPLRLKPNVKYRIGSYGHMFSRVSEAKNTNDIDILFLGSSRAYRSFDPRIYSKVGLKTFNLGSSAQTPFQTDVLLQRYWENLNPKLVIFDISPRVFNLDGVESSLDIIANDRNDWYSFDMALKVNNIKTYNTLIYGATRDLFNLNETYTEPIIKGSDTYISGGFVEKEISYFKPIPIEEKEIHLDQSQLESFSKIISFLNSKNTKVILVYIPIPPSTYNSYTNMAYFDSLMWSYSEYYNFNEINPLNDSLHFYDSYHMNQSGAEIFNKKLIEIINER